MEVPKVMNNISKKIENRLNKITLSLATNEDILS